MFDQPGDGVIAVLAVRDFAQSILPVVAGDADQGDVLVLDHPAAVFVVNRRRKLIPQAKKFNVADGSSHDESVSSLAN